MKAEDKGVQLEANYDHLNHQMIIHDEMRIQ